MTKKAADTQLLIRTGSTGRATSHGGLTAPRHDNAERSRNIFRNVEAEAHIVVVWRQIYQHVDERITGLNR